MKAPFLLIDAGNTRVKWATAHARGPIQVRGQIETGKLTAARVAALSRQFPKHQVVLASVVPKLVPWFKSAFGVRLLIVTGKSPALGLPFDYPKPAEIGADRLAASVAVHEMGQWPAIIVLCGTATAFNVLDAKGRFCGGAIAPGLDAQLTALLGATAQLPKTLLRPTRRYLGRSTQEAIRSGLVLNYIGGVKEIIRCLSGVMPGRAQPRVILTGGNAHYLTRALDVPATLKPLLVFEGLRIMGLRYFQPQS